MTVIRVTRAAGMSAYSIARAGACRDQEHRLRAGVSAGVARTFAACNQRAPRIAERVNM